MNRAPRSTSRSDRVLKPTTNIQPIIVVGSLATSMLAIVAVLLLSSSSASNQPGEAWQRGALSGETIRLFDDGMFTREHWCDICPAEVVDTGQWSTTETGITLFPADPGVSPISLLRSDRNGCSALIPEIYRALPNTWRFEAYWKDGRYCEVTTATPCQKPSANPSASLNSTACTREKTLT